MDQSTDTKWLKLTNHGEWATHTVSAACCEMNDGYGRQTFDSWPQSTKISVLNSGSAAVGGYKQEACHRKRLQTLIVVSSVFPDTL